MGEREAMTDTDQPVMLIGCRRWPRPFQAAEGARLHIGNRGASRFAGQTCSCRSPSDCLSPNRSAEADWFPRSPLESIVSRHPPHRAAGQAALLGHPARRCERLSLDLFPPARACRGPYDSRRSHFGVASAVLFRQASAARRQGGFGCQTISLLSLN